MIARTINREPERDSRSLTHSITHRHPSSLSAERQFRMALEHTGKALWIGVLQEMGPLSRNSPEYRARQVDVYVRLSNDQEIPLEEVVNTFQHFAATLKPHHVALHLVPTSSTTPNALKESLRDPQTYRQSTTVWEERLTRNV